MLTAPKPKLLLAVPSGFYRTIFRPADEKRLHEVAALINEEAPARADHRFLCSHLDQAEILITSWDTAPLDKDVLDHAPHLKLVCHAAGTVRAVATDAMWDREIMITSGAEAIAFGVAEFCLGLMLTESKRVTWLAQGTRHGLWTEPSRDFGGAFEIFQQSIGIIGAGHIGRRLIQLLQNFSCRVFLYDPYVSRQRAEELGAQKVESLEKLFASCRIVSLHAPTNENTRHMLRGAHFAALQPGSLFLNTAGSIQIHEEEFIAELEKGKFVACIDRCEIEPCPTDHPFRRLPNVLLTPHVAGVMAENRLRIGAFVVEEIERFINRQPLRNRVAREDLVGIA